MWVGGLKETERAIRSKGIGTVVRTLRRQGHTNVQIAEALHARGVTGRGDGHVTRNVITKRVQRLGLQHRVVWRAGLLRIRELVEQGLSTRLILRELEANGSRHYRKGWNMRIVQDAIRRLRAGHVLHGVSPLPPGAKVLPETRAALALMLRRRGEGRSWRTIADELNTSGLRGEVSAVAL